MHICIKNNHKTKKTKEKCLCAIIVCQPSGGVPGCGGGRGGTTHGPGGGRTYIP